MKRTGMQLSGKVPKCSIPRINKSIDVRHIIYMHSLCVRVGVLISLLHKNPLIMNSFEVFKPQRLLEYIIKFIWHAIRKISLARLFFSQSLLYFTNCESFINSLKNIISGCLKVKNLERWDLEDVVRNFHVTN